MRIEDIELLEVYLKNGQSDKALEKRLNAEPELAEALAQLRIVSEGFQRKATRDKIKAIHTSKMEEWSDDKIIAFKPVKRSLWKVWISVSTAASIAFVLYLGNAQFSLPNELSLSERSIGFDVEHVSTEIFKTYVSAQSELRNGDYEQAALHFSEVNNSEGDIRKYYKDAAAWYEVVALSEINEPLASEKLDALEQQKDFKFPISFLEKLKMKVRLLF